MWYPSLRAIYLQESPTDEFPTRDEIPTPDNDDDATLQV
jgi:hypothetical protein